MPSDTIHPHKRRKTSHPSPRDRTAKFSEEWRRVIRHRAHALRHDTRSMYHMAIRLAAPDVILYIASQVPLPESTSAEDCALQTLGLSGSSGARGDDDWVCPGYTTELSFKHGYEGVNVVYAAVGKKYDNMKKMKKKKFVLGSESRVLDMRMSEIYSSPHGGLQAKIQKRWPLKCRDGKQSKLLQKRTKKNLENSSVAERVQEAKSANLGTDHSCNDGRETAGPMSDDDGGPITPASLIQLYAARCDTKAAYKQLKQRLSDREAGRKQRWRDYKREKRQDPDKDMSRRKSRLWQCWTASDRGR